MPRTLLAVYGHGYGVVPTPLAAGQTDDACVCVWGGGGLIGFFWGGG